MFQIAMIGCMAVCAAILLISALRRKAEALINFILRMVLGTLAIYAANAGAAMLGMEGGITIGLMTVLTSGILGIPGVAALLGIFFYQSL